MSGALGSGVEDMGAIKEDESDEMERILSHQFSKNLLDSIYFLVYYAFVTHKYQISKYEYSEINHALFS